MSEPKDHHYVPKCYLKSFANDKEEIYALSKAYRKIKPFTISMICYELYYFKITENDTLIFNEISDPLYIEKEAFKRHENEYLKLLSEVIDVSSNPTAINKKQMEFFLEILITIKRRNPSLQKSFIDSFDEYLISDSFKNQVTNIAEYAKQVDPEGTEQFLQTDYLADLRKIEGLKDRFRTRFLHNSEVTKQIVDSLLQHKIFIAETDSEAEFITSDNPGFCSLGGLTINIGGFNRDYIFIFPLTPKHCILVHSDYSEHTSPLKNIHQIFLDKALIEETNRATNYVAMSKVFSLTKKPLEIFQT